MAPYNPKSLKNLIPNHGQGVPNAGGIKGKPQRSTIVKKWMTTEQDIKNPITGETQTLTQEDIMTLALIKKARSGDTAAYKEIMNSSYGPPGTEAEAHANAGNEIPLFSDADLTENQITQENNDNNNDNSICTCGSNNCQCNTKDLQKDTDTQKKE